MPLAKTREERDMKERRERERERERERKKEKSCASNLHTLAEKNTQAVENCPSSGEGGRRTSTCQQKERARKQTLRKQQLQWRYQAPILAKQMPQRGHFSQVDGTSDGASFLALTSLAATIAMFCCSPEFIFRWADGALFQIRVAAPLLLRSVIYVYIHLQLRIRLGRLGCALFISLTMLCFNILPQGSL